MIGADTITFGFDKAPATVRPETVAAGNAAADMVERLIVLIVTAAQSTMSTNIAVRWSYFLIQPPIPSTQDGQRRRELALLGLIGSGIDNSRGLRRRSDPLPSDIDGVGGIRIIRNPNTFRCIQGDRVPPASAEFEMRLGVKGELDHPLKQLISGEFREIPED
jgi:hypothetical protein